jgi:hypothetical protein
MSTDLDTFADPIQKLRDKLEFARIQRHMWDTEVQRFEAQLRQREARHD